MYFPTYVGVPTTQEIYQLYRSLVPINLVENAPPKAQAENNSWTKVVQMGLLVFRAFDYSKEGSKFTATTQLLSSGYSIYQGNIVDGILSTARAVISLMGYGQYLFIADIAVTYMREKDAYHAGLSFWQ